MASHSAKSLFDQNIKSTTECIDLFDGVSALKTSLEIDWILRAGIVFSVSALDTYYHDKIKYRAGKYALSNLPPALAKFEVPIRELTTWEEATRKGNVLRNWVVDYYSVRPLQAPKAVADALKIVGINALWDTIEPDPSHKKALMDKIDALVERRNQIAHEGDRKKSRKSGKKLRPIARQDLEDAISLTRDIVSKIETAFPA